jgi:hypothetical protein
MESQKPSDTNESKEYSNRTGKFFFYLFGIPLIVTIALVGIANALGW